MTAPTTRGAPEGPPTGPGPDRLDMVEAAIWYQAKRLVSTDPIVRATAMEVITLAIRAYAEEMAGPIVARRRGILREHLTER